VVWLSKVYFCAFGKARVLRSFPCWGHGDKDLVRGSGLFVGENGLVTNHHFNPIDSKALFRFTPGTYDLELVAKALPKNNFSDL